MGRGCHRDEAKEETTGVSFLVLKSLSRTLPYVYNTFDSLLANVNYSAVE